MGNFIFPNLTLFFLLISINSNQSFSLYLNHFFTIIIVIYGLFNNPLKSFKFFMAIN